MCCARSQVALFTKKLGKLQKKAASQAPAQPAAVEAKLPGKKRLKDDRVETLEESGKEAVLLCCVVPGNVQHKSPITVTHTVYGELW